MKVNRVLFTDVFRDITSGNRKIPKSDYLDMGKVPVIDQGQSLIAGYVNDESAISKVDLPVILFGDHTRAFKFVNFKFALGADGVKILKHGPKDDTRYLYHALKSLRIPSAGYSRHYKFLKEASIPLPPLEEQKRIARILDTAEEIRAKRRQSIEELNRLVQSVFLDMFGDPVTNPKGWEVLPIKSTNSLVQIGPFGSLLHKDDYVQDGIPLINPKHIKNDKITPDYNETINSEKFDELKKYVLEKGDVVLARRGEMGRCAIVENDSRKMICGTGSLFIRPNVNHITSVYLKHILSTRALKAELEKIAWGVTMANLNSSKVENLKLILPPIEIQHAFEKIIKSIEAQKSLHQQHLTELENLFASLQSRAFNGTL
jgi:type I restriction enzyme, S subunit